MRRLNQPFSNKKALHSLKPPKIIADSSLTSFCSVLQLRYAQQRIDNTITPKGSIYLKSEILKSNTCSGNLIFSITVV